MSGNVSALAEEKTVPLPTAPLGTTGMELTRVGFGAWAIGGGEWTSGWGPQDDDTSIQAIQHAVACGVNWVDTAAVYGLGHSEEVVAAALRGIPEAERPYVFTKCGQVGDPNDRSVVPAHIMAPGSVRREIEDSLRRLRVERIDLYQVHSPPQDGTLLEDYWGLMLELRDAGKVRAVGLSNHDVAQLESAERLGHVDSLQPPFSAINRAAADELAWCHRNGTGVIVYSPMQSGLLTGKFTEQRVAALPDGDWRRTNPNYTTKLSANLALADALRPVAERHDVSVASVAVTWTLAWPGVTGAIVGARGPSQVDGWLPAADLTLTEADLDEIAEAINRTGAGHGQARP